MRIFISSAQKEFDEERAALGEFIGGDVLLSKFYEAFIFERDIPAADRRPDEVYLDEVANCDLYLGIFGDEYGWENDDGLSPTHLEFNEATRLNKPRLIYVKGTDDTARHAKMRDLIREAGAQLIPSLQAYKGTAFELVDQAVDFVMSKINVSVGTRERGPQAPVAYEIPRDVVSEAIVNAVAHRDYTSNGSVQVMLFADRLEVWNPGTLPPSLTLDKLREIHGSFPGNPLLAEPLYLTKYIERMGTGTGDMIRRCREAGLPEPEFRLGDGFSVVIRRPAPAKATEPPAGGGERDQVGTKSGPSRDQVLILDKCLVPSGIGDLMKISGRTNRTKFRNQVLRPLLEDGFMEMTIPDKPTSSKQQYRTTEKGRSVMETKGGES